MMIVKSSLLLLLLMLALVSPGQRAYADEWPPPPVVPTPTDPKTKKKVDVDVKETPLRKVLEALFKGSGMRFEVEQRIPDCPITLEIHDISFDIAVRLIVRQTSVRVDGITHQFKKGVYRIYIRPPHEDDPTTLK